MIPNAPTMQLADQYITIRYDHQGLVIVRNTANSDDTTMISLSPQEATSFSTMWTMAQAAAQIAGQLLTDQVFGEED